ncbi:2-amino-4-hydroxy-6-hydroxymethyldihydropteridinediphosphokinase [Allochromatium warmingii]|uniref:2-amino-4-hydroxy-6-hydroxymethyldihydropteridine pyrophosphokinase n=1 Tax=Allochromatium warmingii TaxID=61595 RepID=A0A1H3FRU4_ALLWA|nr:2-amino-4-hydroxy-6-hydroxymethyldihydropteridine diphosphokinase [Allochromatium warmingii]SDX92884.1 2-amino-4-hydroxy-6-hydroxymethyldihydropteridinediphosphokinase [Allochromatium warmingii]
MNHVERVFIAVGSNIEPEQQITNGLTALAALPKTRLGAESAWYRTRPWGVEAQAPFINLVVELWTELEPLALLTALQAIEQQCGRVRTQLNGPRTLDLDVLLYGARIVDQPSLRVPHPGLVVRDFMLIPLVEIAPEVIHPEYGRPVAALTDAICYWQISERL